MFFPFIKPVPHIEAGGKGADIERRVCLEQRLHHQGAPRANWRGPGKLHVPLFRGCRHCFGFASRSQQFFGHLTQGICFVASRPTRRARAMPLRCWHGGLRGADKGKEFRHIEMALVVWPSCRCRPGITAPAPDAPPEIRHGRADAACQARRVKRRRRRQRHAIKHGTLSLRHSCRICNQHAIPLPDSGVRSKLRAATEARRRHHGPENHHTV